MIRTNNPALRQDVFAPPQTWADLEGPATKSTAMTLQGTVNATLILLAICSACAVAGWAILAPALGAPAAGVPAGMGTSTMVVLGGGLVGFILALVVTFKPRTAPYLAPVYAGVEGVFIGGLSAMYAWKFGDALVLQAGLLTFGILFSLLIAYSTRLIKATENFKLGVTAATGGVFLLFMASMVLGLFGIQIPYIWDSGPIGIGVAAFIVLLASLNLVLDFDFIEQGAASGAPKHLEWYGAFGLLVTLVWLYVSLLRLLSLLSNRD